MCQRLEAVEYSIFELYTVNLHLCYFELQWSLKSAMCRPPGAVNPSCFPLMAQYVDLSTAPEGRHIDQYVASHSMTQNIDLSTCQLLQKVDTLTNILPSV